MQLSRQGFRMVAGSLVGVALLGAGALAGCSDDTSDHEHDDDHGATGGNSGGSDGKGSGGTRNTGGKPAGTGGTSLPEGGALEEQSLTFRAVVGSAPVDCTKTYAGLGTSQKELVPVDFRFYVHDIRFIDAAGKEAPAELVADGKWQTDRVGLLDFENNQGTCENGTGETHDEVVVRRPAGSYLGIAFRIGVPEDLNHANPVAAGSPLNLTALHWSWNFGYKFARLDFKLAPGEAGMGPMQDAGMGPMQDGGAMGDGGMGMDMGPPGVVLLHLGSTGCVTADAGSAGCASANRPEIRLSSFDPGKQVIQLDYAKLVTAVDAAKDEGGAPGCMSDPADRECKGIFDALGLDLKTGKTKSGQTAFTAVDE
jgi:uncharacterized repeat protein (TIGR04052 family)